MPWSPLKFQGNIERFQPAFKTVAQGNFQSLKGQQGLFLQIVGTHVRTSYHKFLAHF